MKPAAVLIAWLCSVPLSGHAAQMFAFDCEQQQTLKVAYPDRNTALLAYQHQLLRLKIARSASGARYVGEGWQWWTHQGEGTLAKLATGENIASAAGIHCHRPVNPKKRT